MTDMDKTPYDIVVIWGDMLQKSRVNDAIHAAQAAGRHVLLIGDGGKQELKPSDVKEAIDHAEGRITSDTAVIFHMHGEATAAPGRTSDGTHRKIYNDNNMTPFLKVLLPYGAKSLDIFACQGGAAMPDTAETSVTHVTAHASRTYEASLHDAQKGLYLTITRGTDMRQPERIARCAFMSSETIYVDESTRITAPKAKDDTVLDYSNAALLTHIIANTARIYAHYGEPDADRQCGALIEEIRDAADNITQAYRESLMMTAIFRHKLPRLAIALKETEADALRALTPQILIDAAASQKTEAVEYLIDAGVNPYVSGGNNNSLLHLLSTQKHHAAFDKVVAQYSDEQINARNHNGNTPLILAAWYRRTENIRCLAERGADANAVNNEGNSALMLSVKTYNGPAVRLLAEHGADVNTIDKHGNSAMIVAVLSPYPPLVAILAEHGADVNAVDKHGDAALIVAIDSDNTDTMRLLLEHGAHTDITDRDGDPLLLHVTERYKICALEELISHGMDIHAADDNGRTPVMLAAEKGYDTTIRILKHYDADMNAADTRGSTPLMFAAQAGHADIIHRLAEYGANVNAVDHTGRSALDYAMDAGKPNALKALLQHTNLTRDTLSNALDRHPDADMAPMLTSALSTLTCEQPSSWQVRERLRSDKNGINAAPVIDM